MYEVLILLTVCVTAQANTHVYIRKELSACPDNRTDTDGEAGTHDALMNCTSKISLSWRITNEGKLAEDPRYVVVDSVYDKAGHEEVRLLNPIVVEIRQELLVLAYPFHHQYSVNGGMYEVILNGDNTKGYVGCSVEAGTIPDCQRLDKDQNPVKGFCCECDQDPRITHHPRGGQSCKPTISSPLPSSSSHCFMHDELWYSVNALSPPSVRHLLRVRLYQEWESPPGGPRQWKPLIDKDIIALGTDRINVSLPNVYGTYSTSFEYKHNPPLDHAEQLLLIPQPPDVGGPDDDQDQKQDPSNYLVVDKNAVDRSGMSCDKIGVQSEAFMREPRRCQQPAQSCLGNQPIQLWLDDRRALLQNKTPRYLLSSYAKPSSQQPLLRTKDPSNLLTFEFTESHTSHIYLEINADQTVVLHKGAHGIIEEVYVESDALSTKVTVRVLNSGLVSSDFGVRIANCSGPGSHNYDVHSTQMGPQQSQTFTFTIQNIKPQDMNLKTTQDDETCVVELVNHKRQRVAQRMMPYQPLDRCVCLAYCQCTCLSEGSLGCIHLSQSEYNEAGYKGVVPVPLGESSLGDKLYRLEITFLILAMLLFFGLCKMIGGAMISSSVGSLGLCLWMTPRLQKYHEPDLAPYKVVHRHIIPVNPITGEPCRRLSLAKEILLNIIFFFYLPFIPLHWCCTALFDKIAGKPQNNEEYPQYVRRSLDELLQITRRSDEDLVRPLLPPGVKKPAGRLDKNFILQLYNKQKKFIKDQKDQTTSEDEELGPTPRQEGEHGKKYESSPDPKSDLSTEEDKTLDRLCEPGAAVYNNYTEPSSHLWCSGDEYSLCGHLRKVGNSYKFTLGPQLTQLYDCSSFRGSHVLLTPLPINPKYFQESMSAADVLQRITEKPLYLCLNEAGED